MTAYMNKQGGIACVSHFLLGNKVDVQFPYILVWKLHTQACEIVAGTKRKLCKKIQVDICKTKKDRSVHRSYAPCS